MSKPKFVHPKVARRRGPEPAQLARRVLLTLGLLALALLAAPLTSQARIDFSLCDVCRRVWDDSPARMKATVDLGHNHSRKLLACSPFCMCERMEDYKDKPIGTLQIVMHKEHKESGALMLIAERSWYLVEIDGNPKKDSEPHVGAYRNKKAAEEAQKELGGKVEDWAALKARILKLTDEWEPNAPKEYPPLRPGRKND